MTGAAHPSKAEAGGKRTALVKASISRRRKRGQHSSSDGSPPMDGASPGKKGASSSLPVHIDDLMCTSSYCMASPFFDRGVLIIQDAPWNRAIFQCIPDHKGIWVTYVQTWPSVKNIKIYRSLLHVTLV